MDNIYHQRPVSQMDKEDLLDELEVLEECLEGLLAKLGETCGSDVSVNSEYEDYQHRAALIKCRLKEEYGYTSGT